MSYYGAVALKQLHYLEQGIHVMEMMVYHIFRTGDAFGEYKEDVAQRFVLRLLLGPSLKVRIMITSVTYVRSSLTEQKVLAGRFFVIFVLRQAANVRRKMYAFTF